MLLANVDVPIATLEYPLILYCPAPVPKKTLLRLFNEERISKVLVVELSKMVYRGAYVAVSCLTDNTIVPSKFEEGITLNTAVEVAFTPTPPELVKEVDVTPPNEI